MVAAGGGDDLAESVFAVVDHGAAAFVGDAALSADVDVPVLDVGEVEEDQLDAVGVDAAQVGGDQRVADEGGMGRGDTAGFEHGGGEAAQAVVREDRVFRGHFP